MYKKKNFKQEFNKNKYQYIFLMILSITGIVSGILFANILSYSDYQLVKESLKDYFFNIKNNTEINYFKNFLNAFSINYIYMFAIWILGLSIIGVLLSVFLLFFKNFILGFSIASIISIYEFKGIIGVILYLFPHQVLNIIIYILLTYYAINTSIKLFKALFMKKVFNWGEIIRKYMKILAISSISLLISSLYETFLGNFAMKLFTFLLK